MHVRMMTMPVVALVALLTLTAAKPGGDAVGRWSSTDPADGSAQTMRITPSLQMRFVDELASISCPETQSAASVSGRLAQVGPDTVGGDVTIRCRSGETPAPSSVYLDFTYDSGTDTLLDNQGGVWLRD